MKGERKLRDEIVKQLKDHPVTEITLMRAYHYSQTVLCKSGLALSELLSLITQIASYSRKSGKEVGEAITFMFEKMKYENLISNQKPTGSVLREIKNNYNKLSNKKQAEMGKTLVGLRRIWLFNSIVSNIN